MTWLPSGLRSAVSNAVSVETARIALRAVVPPEQHLAVLLEARRWQREKGMTELEAIEGVYAAVLCGHYMPGWGDTIVWTPDRHCLNCRNH